jgi:Domain of unknown function (DUF6089)
MKISKFFILLLLILIPTITFSQRWKLSRASYSYGIGISNYFGDIGGSMKTDASGFADIDLLNSRPTLTVGYRYKLHERIAVKANLSYANIYGSDVNSKKESRNYAFSTNLFELNGHVEFHITKEKTVVSYKTMSMRGKLRRFNVGLNFYMFAGAGVAYYKPKAKDNLLNDPRFNDSKNFGVVVPFGVGVRYPLTTKTSIGLEIGRRFITSDYVDGLSPENSANEHKDGYYFTVINVSYKIKRKSNSRKELRF